MVSGGICFGLCFNYLQTSVCIRDVFAHNADFTIRSTLLLLLTSLLPEILLCLCHSRNQRGAESWCEWGPHRHPSGRASSLGDLLFQNPNRAWQWHVFDSLPQTFALHSTFLNWLDGIYPLLGRDGWDCRQFDLCQLFNLWQLLSTVVHFNYCSWVQMSQRWAQCLINTINTDNISNSASFLGEQYGATDCPFFPAWLPCLPVFSIALEGAVKGEVDYLSLLFADALLITLASTLKSHLNLYIT